MSQQSSAPADSLAAIATLTDEITLQQVYLVSLNDSSGDQSARKAEIEAEIAILRKELSAIQASSSHAQASSTSHDNSYTRPSDIGRSKMNSTVARGSNAGYQFKEEGEPAGSLSSTASTPGSGASMFGSGSHRADLPTRKRTLSKHLDMFVPFEEVKSRRTTPSPFATGVTTPSGSSGYGYNANGDGYFDLTMDDDIVMFDPAFTERQKQEEQKFQRERKDAEFASSLAESSIPVSNTPMASSKPSAFHRMYGGHSGGLSQASTSRNIQAAKSSVIPNTRDTHNSDSSSRSLPWKKGSSSSLKAEPRTSSHTQPSPSGFIGWGSGDTTDKGEPRTLFYTQPSPPGFVDWGSDGTTGVHREQSFTSMNSNSMPGAYIDDAASDSSLEIIDSSAFKDNGRQKATVSKTSNYYSQPGPIYSSETRVLGDIAVGRTNTSLQGDPASSNWAKKSPNGMENPSGNISDASTWMIGSYDGGMNNESRVEEQNSYSTPWEEDQLFAPYNGMNAGYKDFSMSGTSSAMSYNDTNPSGAYLFDYSNSTMPLTVPGSITGSVHSSHPQTSMHGPGSAFSIDSLSEHGMGSTNFNSLRGTINNARNFSDVESNLSFLPTPFAYTPQMTERMEHVINDPRKTEKEIKDLLENIKAEIEIPLEDREGTPEGLRYPLYEHQKIALTWLKQMEEGSNKGGILADDMGLGKTISTLSLILSRPSTDHARKTTLIAAPVALLRQWNSEIASKTLPTHKPSVYMAHGNSKRATWDDLREYDVVLTTYGTLGAEYTRLVKFEEESKRNGITNHDPKQMAKDFPFLGPNSRFYRVILDEAQCIKNKTTKAAASAYRLTALTRFCLTGTPMMNNITELYSLIKFLRIRPYSSWTSFVKDFGCLSKGGSHSEEYLRKTMQRLQGVLKAILLRRTKKSQIDGKPIINLPPKFEHVDHVIFSKDEQEFYQALKDKTQLQFNKYRKAGTVGKNYSNILVLLLRLRQCCCHPHLIIDLEEAAAGSAELTEEQMIDRAMALEPDVVSRLLAADGGFECNICYDATPNPSIIIPCGHDNCHDCLMALSEQAKQAARGDEDGATALKCPSCRGKLDMANLIDYRIFKKAHIPSPDVKGEEMIDNAVESSDDSNSDTESESDSDTTSDDVDENGNLDGFVVPDEIEDDEAEQGDDEIDSESKVSKSKSKSKSTWKSKSKTKAKKNKGKGKEVEKRKQHLSIAMMKKEASRSIAGHRKYMRYLRKNWQSSGKTDKCVELLEKFQNEGEKTIIFSQFVTFLDLLQVPIGEKGWKCERYDGSINSKRRDEAIKRFQDKPDCNIMLISLKAGNAGLNLTAASRVIILDPFWNPFIEMQAVDRAYRIGQMKTVQVHRILVQETVEDRIMELQRQKKSLVESALDEGAMKSVGRLDEKQLAFLFGV
ncbi:Bculs1 [Botrytis cinerea B05.10]|uniref:Bculs1 n=1 Tax=Botryotinia fuckeliana (strain B05.10) TaxID=332648 RepID=A0A384JQK0_BOTFB|nr:Bculs1 [Botrytis cinerea B05.10]ATZ52859.1 Bculs1 [Botrytis cinerea B05.10]